MARRIYFQSIIKWVKENKRKTGVGTLIGSVFAFLIIQGLISDYQFSGDSVCAGNYEDPCVAYINFTAKDDIFLYRTDYDPWGRNESFSFSPAVKSWNLQRSWGTGWRDIPLNKSCTGTWCGAPDSKGDYAYSVVFREGRDYQIRILAYKNSPYEDIKWSAFSGEIDPVWFGIRRFLSDNISDNKVRASYEEFGLECDYHITRRNTTWIPWECKVENKNQSTLWNLQLVSNDSVDYAYELWRNHTFPYVKLTCVNRTESHRNGTVEEIQNCNHGWAEKTEFGWQRFNFSQSIDAVSKGGTLNLTSTAIDFLPSDRLRIVANERTIDKSVEFDLYAYPDGKTLSERKRENRGLGIDPGADLDDGLLHAYSFEDETVSGSAITDIFGSNDITKDDPTSTTGHIGEGFNFDNSGDHMESDGNVGVSGSSDRTVCLWAKEDANDDQNWIFTLGDNGGAGTMFAMTVDGSDNLNFIGISADFDTGINWPTDGEYHSVCAVYDGSVVSTYYDGVDTPTTDQTLSLSTTSDSLLLGAHYAQTTHWWDGDMDMVTIWDVALSDADILTFNASTIECEGDPCSFAEEDTTEPSFSTLNNNASSSLNGHVVNWTTTISDDTELSFCKFGTNDSGSWVSSNWQSCTTPFVFSWNETIDSTSGQYVCGNFTANDTSNNVGGSGNSCFTVSESPSYNFTFNLTINNNLSVEQNRFFTNFSVNVTCVDSNCGDVNVTLDPQAQSSEGFTERIGVGWDAFFDEDDTFNGDENSLVSDFLDGTGEIVFIAFDLANLSSKGNIQIHNATLVMNVSPPIAGADSDNDIEILWFNNVTWDESDIDDMCGDGVVCDSIWTLFEHKTLTYNGDNVGNLDYIGGLANDVQMALGNESSRTGWALNNSENDAADFYQWASRESLFPSAWGYLEVNYSIIPGSSSKGNIPVDSGNPFYVDSGVNGNPVECGLNVGESCTVTWSINATGDPNSSYIFFAFANQTGSILNFSEQVNITIIDFSEEPTPDQVGDILNLNSSSLYLNLSSAINEASDGDVITIIREITISDNVNVTVDNLVINSNASTQPLIVTSRSGGFNISAQNITISKISIQSTSGSAINVSGYDNHTFSYLNITTTDSSDAARGIYTVSANNLFIGHNNITTGGSGNNNDGIHLEQSDNHNITHNYIDTYGVNANHPIHIEDSDFNTVSDNIVNASGSGIRQIGIHFKTGAENNEIRFNQINTSGLEDGWGIWYDNSNNNRDFRNTIIIGDLNEGATVGSGIYIQTSHNTVVQENYVFTINKTGVSDSKSLVWVDGNSFNTTIINNNGTIISNSTIGIYITGGFNVTASGNNITVEGLYTGLNLQIVTNFSNMSFENNIFEQYGSVSIANVNVNLVGEGTVFRNNIVKSFTNGTIASNIILGGGVFMDVSNNTIITDGVESVGIRSNSANHSTIKNNIITSFGQASYAIKVGNTSVNNTFYNNIINSTKEYINVTDNVQNFYNSSLQTGKNIVGGSNVGGNFYANSSNPTTGYSETCSDADSDDICDSAYSFNGIVDYHPLSIPGGTNPCSCPSPAADWNIEDNQCDLTSYCDIRGFNVFVNDGWLSVKNGGVLSCNVPAVLGSGWISEESGGILECGLS